MPRLRSAALVLGLALAAAAPADSPLELRAGPDRVALLELYTSEGCSSCPPADRWVSELTTDPRLWTELVPVAFHVDYWDYIGWPDRFAARTHGERQREYARQGDISTVYTPGLVVDGEEWRRWFVLPVLRLGERAQVGVLEMTVDADAARARFTPVRPIGGPLALTVAVLGFGLETEVPAGENAGRTLRHDFVVLGHRTVRMRAQPADGGGFEHVVDAAPLPGRSAEAPRLAVAAWVSPLGSPAPLQAIGGWLGEAR